MHAQHRLVPWSVLLLAAPITAWAPAASAQSKPIFPRPHYKLHSQTPFATQPYDGALADFDADGKLDHAAAMNATTGYVALSFGDGLGGFAPPQYVPTGKSPNSLLSADFDGDGAPDLAVACTGEQKVWIHRNQGGGTFAPTAQIPYGAHGGFELASADLDVDGDLDLVVQRSSPDFPLVLLGDGAGGFTPGPALPISSMGPFVDLTGDGAPDALQLIYPPLAAELWANDGTGTLVNQGIAVPLSLASTSGVTAGDVDADGKLDAIAIGYEDSLEVALGNGAGGFGPPVLYPVAHVQGLLPPILGDFTGDGVVDLAAESGTQATISIFPGVGGGAFAAPDEYFVGVGVYALEAGQIDGDGRLDLAAVSVELNALAVMLSDGPAGFTATASEPLGVVPGVLELVDLDGDAHRDALLLSGASSFFLLGYDGLATALGDGLGGFGAASTFTPSMRPMSALAADWTGDFDLDVVVATTTASAHELQLWAGDGLGGLSHASTHAAGATPLSDAAAEDVNGDGRRDVLFVPGTNTGPSSVTWVAGDGLGGFAPPSSVLPCDENGCARVVRTADLNADGKRDLIVVTSGLMFTPSALKTYLGDGAGGFALAFQTTSLGSAQIELVDLSGDGLPDLLAHYQNNGLAVYPGLGNGAFGAPASYTFYTSSSLLNSGGTLELGDVDADGRVDVVTSPSYHGTFYVYRGDGLGGFVRDRGYAAPNGASAALGDVDEDGQLDVVAADADAKALTVVENLAPCTGTVQTYGLGCPGTSGFVPAFSVFGCPEPGKQLSVRLSGGLGGSVGFVLHGLVPAHLALPGGCEFLIDQLLPVVTAMPLSAGAAGTGAKTLTFTLGPVGPSGADFAMQAVVFDPVAAFSFSSTNGVRLVIQ